MNRTLATLLVVVAGFVMLQAAGVGESASLGSVALQAGASAEVLMQADREFNAAVAEGGSQAWASWFAEDGATIQPGIGEVRGRARILELMAALDDPSVSLAWEPDRADIAASGDLGWTTGHYVSESPGPDGSQQRSEGLYVSIWRRQPDGAWKVVMDLGNPVGSPTR
jgi:ketosteroid isomerase-like protein